MASKEKKDVIFVLFGATGDLATKKIFPALASLHTEGKLSSDSRVIAVSRRDWFDDDFRKHIPHIDKGFLGMVTYCKTDIDAGSGYTELSKKIKEAHGKLPDAELVLHLSIAAKNQEKAIRALFENKIISRGEGKLLVEKPFGTDEATAKSLDKLLLAHLNEDQICRVDHYLGKDTVIAIMDLHESTENFSLMLSRETVESIRIRLFEEKGIDGRGESYDHVGAFRDVGQNHILEMLAVLAAESPKGKWQRARTDVLTHLAPPAKTCELSRRGQYEGYEHEKGVKQSSETETAFEVITSLSAGKLLGVPLILEAGKRMGVSEAFIEIGFRDMPDVPEKMRFSIQPEQEIAITYRGGKTDKFGVIRTRDAYANVILSAIEGTSRSFVGSEEIEALWRYSDHVVACWGKVPLERYSEGKPFLIE